MEKSERGRERAKKPGLIERTLASNGRELGTMFSRARHAGLIQKGKIDIVFLIILFVILVFGLVMLFSASGPKALQEEGDRYYYIKRQLIYVAAGLVVMYLFSRVNTEMWRIFIKPFLFIVLLLLIYVKFFGYKGRWIVLPGITFQPSELAKFGLIVYISHIIASDPESVKKLDKFLGKILVPFGIFEVLIVTEPHLSATILVFLICMTIIFIGGLDRKIVIGCCALAGIAVVLVLVFGRSYWQDRIDVWFDPYSDPTGDSYQTLQSLRAIGSGGVLGVGLGESTQKYLWLPEPQNDFIFSVVCEELGFVGGFAVLMLFLILVWRGYSISMKCKSKYNALLVIGLVSQVGYQALLNAAVATNAVPNTGISLPFFSYGGTAMLMLLAQMGVVLSASRVSRVSKV